MDAASYGRAAANREGGVFTEHGYLTELPGGFKEIYRGLRDIPAEYRVIVDGSSSLIVKNADLPSFLMKLYAVTDTPLKDLRHDLETLAAFRSTEYLLLTTPNGSFLTEAANVYRSGSPAFETWMGTDTALAFSIHVTNIQGQMTGDVVQLNFPAHRQEILENRILPVRIEALARPISEDVFLINLNFAYMDQAQNQQIDMLRISREAAKEMLARGDGEVFRLLPEGPVKLSAMDAVKNGGLRYPDHREFAIKCEELTGLDKWAERGAAEALRAVQRDTRKKREPEL
ncbi:MAG: hypothetical protein FWC62_09530 [Firmicutes bacterium]|nr:hypothetical protein [Bacillota bacterium]